MASYISRLLRVDDEREVDPGARGCWAGIPLSEEVEIPVIASEVEFCFSAYKSAIFRRMSSELNLGRAIAARISLLTASV